MPTPEQQARDQIDRMLDAAGWAVQDAAGANLSAGRGILSICSVAALSEISQVCMISELERRPLRGRRAGLIRDAEFVMGCRRAATVQAEGKEVRDLVNCPIGLIEQWPLPTVAKIRWRGRSVRS